MTGREPDNQQEYGDLIDSIPVVNRVASNLQRSFGPSCLISLIITALLLILLRRFLKFGPLGIAIVTFVVWWAIMVMLVRFGKSNPPDDDEDD